MFRYVSLILAALFLAVPAAHAAHQIQRGSGLLITFATTNEAFDFEFESTAVEICVHGGLGASPIIYGRFGTSMTTLEGRDTTIAEWATTSAIFQTGNSRLAGRALVFTNRGTLAGATTTPSTVPDCRIYPFATRGMVFNTDTVSKVTMDVNAFSSK